MRELSFAVGSLALLLVFPGPVGLLTVLTTVSSVPATPVDGLSLALVTPLFLLGLGDSLLVFLNQIFHF